MIETIPKILIYVVVPIMSLAILIYAFYNKEPKKKRDKKYKVKFQTKSGKFKIENII